MRPLDQRMPRPYTRRNLSTSNELPTPTSTSSSRPFSAVTRTSIETACAKPEEAGRPQAATGKIGERSHEIGGAAMASRKKVAGRGAEPTKATGPAVSRSQAQAPKKPSIPQYVRIGDLQLPSAFFRSFGISEEGFEEALEFNRLKDPARITVARQLIQRTVIDARGLPDARFPLAVAASQSLLGGYATLDEPHRAEITRLIEQVTAYLHDETRKRPFNVLMLAAPGAGKSHFIKKLAESMKSERVKAVTFNMATMQSAADMAQPIDELRNLKVDDRYPLLFLDEFDSDRARFASLLPLLWDGELHIGHRDLKFGKAVIVLAGSSRELPKTMAQAAEMQLESEAEGTKGDDKLVDLLSRINGGVINIPDLDLRTANRDRRVDKVCVAVTLLRSRFGKELEVVPRALLRFVAHTRFRYGVRSLAHLIDMIGHGSLEGNELKLSSLDLPIASEETLQESSLRLHLLDKDKGFGIVNRWRDLSKDDVPVMLEAKASALLRMLSRS